MTLNNQTKGEKEEMNRTYLYAYDPKIKRRVIHVRKNRKCISLITGHSFTLTNKELKELGAAKKEGVVG